MQKLNIVQGSDEWLEIRRKYVTSTDFCVLASKMDLCENIYNTSLKKLVKSKKEVVKTKDNIFFMRGRENEGKLIDMVSDTAIKGEVWVNDSIGALASLDGRDGDLVIEAKYTTKTGDKLISAIEYWKFQVAHQCYTSGCTNGVISIKADSMQEHFLINVIPEEVIDYKFWKNTCNNFKIAIDIINENVV